MKRKMKMEEAIGSYLRRKLRDAEVYLFGNMSREGEVLK